MYNDCIICPKLGKSCDGPNFVAMSAQELLSWCKLRKKHLDLSNGDLAEMSGIPKGTIDRLLSGEHMDFRYETVRPLVKALVGSEWSGIPCPNPNGTDATHLQEEIERLRFNNQKLREFLENSEKQHKEDAEFQHDEVKHWQKAYEKCRKVVAILGIFLGVALLLLIAALIVDKFNQDIGFFWTSDISSLLH